MKPEVILKFKELVKAGIIEEELDKQSSMNIKLPVMNLKVWWTVIASYKGWEIQQNNITSHYRIIGPGDIRHAFGTEEYISKRIMGININRLTDLLGSPSPTNEKMVFKEFDRLVDSDKLLGRLNEQANTNIDFPTMGGDFFWDNLHTHRGWRIQQNIIFSNCRILGPNDTRYAWGCKNYLFRRIMGHPINRLVNYLLNNGTSFTKYPTSVSPSKRKGSVILIHGLGSGAIDMEWFAKEMTLQGYDAHIYDYQSLSNSIAILGKQLLDDLKILFNTLPHGENINIITHSLGGVLIRKALELDTEPNSIGRRLNCIVMLAPPNKGSIWADMAFLLNILDKSKLIEKTLPPAVRDLALVIESIKPPAFYTKRIGIIAGKYDNMVTKDRTHIPGMTEGIDYELIEINEKHASLRTSKKALDLAISFFHTGHF